MNKQEVISEIENMPYVSITQMGKRKFIELIQKIDEPEKGYAEQSPQYLKNILERLRELPLHDREVWLKAIMSEFEQDFSHAKWREGYEQGKFESMTEREKVKIPEFVANIIEKHKVRNAPIIDIFTEKNYKKEYSWWLATSLNAYDRVARAWLDGYEIGEQKYVVTDGNHLYFKKYQEDVEIVILVDEQPGTMDYVKKFDTREEAQEVADILGWKVEEVKNES